MFNLKIQQFRSSILQASPPPCTLGPPPCTPGPPPCTPALLHAHRALHAFRAVHALHAPSITSSARCRHANQHFATCHALHTQVSTPHPTSSSHCILLIAHIVCTQLFITVMQLFGYEINWKDKIFRLRPILADSEEDVFVFQACHESLNCNKTVPSVAFILSLPLSLFPCHSVPWSSFHPLQTRIPGYTLPPTELNP